MKRLLQLLPALLLLSAPAFAADVDDYAAVRRADQRRIVATIASDAATLHDVLSADLRYAQADGRVLSKEGLIQAVLANKTHFLSVRPDAVEFQTIAPGAVAMIGRAEIVAESGGQQARFIIHFLAVWRSEAGHWRLLAYQSGPLPDAAGQR